LRRGVCSDFPCDPCGICSFFFDNIPPYISVKHFFSGTSSSSLGRCPLPPLSDASHLWTRPRVFQALPQQLLFYGHDVRYIFFFALAADLVLSRCPRVRNKLCRLLGFVASIEHPFIVPSPPQFTFRRRLGQFVFRWTPKQAVSLFPAFYLHFSRAVWRFNLAQYHFRRLQFRLHHLNDLGNPFFRVGLQTVERCSPFILLFPPSLVFYNADRSHLTFFSEGTDLACRSP